MKAIMYHYIRPRCPRLPRHPYLRLDDFRAQLDWIGREVGFVSRAQFLEALDSGRPCQGAILTFDDGLLDHFSYVYPELVQRGLWGIFYIATGAYETRRLFDFHRIHVLLGVAGGVAAMSALNELVTDEMLPDMGVEEFKNKTYSGFQDDTATTLFKRSMNYFINYKYLGYLLDALEKKLGIQELSFDDFYMSETQIADMHGHGMVIGAHTVSHPVLSKLPIQQQRHEIERSISFLSGVIEDDVETFAYPYGGFHTFSGETEKLLSAAGISYTLNVEPRDILVADLTGRRQALPRYDCNLFPHGTASREIAG